VVRMVSRLHVIEEARHVRYAREELARQVREAGPRRLARDRIISARAAYLTGRRLISPDVYASVGIDPAAGHKAAWSNPAYRETLRWAGEKVVTYLRDLGLVAGPGLALWRRSGLL
jgi:hypothetical protein